MNEQTKSQNPADQQAKSDPMIAIMNSIGLLHGLSEDYHAFLQGMKRNATAAAVICVGIESANDLRKNVQDMNTELVKLRKENGTLTAALEAQIRKNLKADEKAAHERDTEMMPHPAQPEVEEAVK